MDLEQARTAIADGGRRLLADGLVVGTAGNLSVRVGERIAISPSGVDYDAVTPDDVAVVTLDGVHEAGRPPSTELPLHLATYRRPDVAAIVHTHSAKATALGLVADVLPAVHYLVVDLGGPVPVLPFALPGSEELATAIAGALADPGRTALLLRNHGTVTVGDTLARAHARAVTLEWLAGLWHDASLHGDPAVVTDAELAAVAEHLTGYFDR